LPSYSVAFGGAPMIAAGLGSRQASLECSGPKLTWKG
jgi:hypothetical protein